MQEMPQYSNTLPCASSGVSDWPSGQIQAVVCWSA